MAAAVCGGCALLPRGRESIPTAPPPDVVRVGIPVPDYSILDRIAAVCFIMAAAAFIGSFLWPMIPRRAAVAALACAVAAWMVKALLVKFFPFMVWAAFGLLIVGGGLALWPYAVALYRRGILRTASTLAAAGDVRAATALEVVAVPKRFPDKAARVARVKFLTDRLGGIGVR